MPHNIYVNLPVRDLRASMDFFAALGFSFDSRFTNDMAAAMIVSDDNYVMLLRDDFFATFTPKPVADASATTEVMTALSVDSREEVDAFVGKALAAGASETRDPLDHGFMYERLINDLDGHIWGIFWMEMPPAGSA